MRRVGIWFWLSIKRWLCRPGFAAIAVLMPVLLWGVHVLEPETPERILVGVAAEGDGLGRQVAEDLTGYEGMFSFVWYDSPKQAAQAVAKKELECAYVFPADLENSLERGTYRRSITVYTAPSTVLADLTGEVVFAALAARYDPVILEEYVAQEDAFKEDPEKARAEALELYGEYAGNGSTFQFEYGMLGDQSGLLEPEAPEAARVFPVRGLLAVFLFLTAVFSAYHLGEDERRGLFLPLLPAERPLCKAAVLMAPAAVLGVSGLAALALTGEWKGKGLEVGAMVLYVLACSAWAGLARSAVRKHQILAALVPFLALALLVLCPIFVDASRYWPIAEALRKFFPAAWYLEWFR